MTPAVAQPDQQIDLPGRQRLTIVRAREDGGEDVLSLAAADGKTTITLRVGPEGATIELGAAALAVRVEGDLAIDAGRGVRCGRDGIDISSGGDLTIAAASRLETRASEQKLVATLGDMSLHANDDVKIDGERIRMNC